MRWLPLLVLVGCATTRGLDESKARQVDDRCFATLASAQAPQQERDNCHAWLRQRTDARTAALNAQAARAYDAQLAAVILASQPRPAPARPVILNCAEMYPGAVNCVGY